jgi:hypothetical protein
LLAHWHYHWQNHRNDRCRYKHDSGLANVNLSLHDVARTWICGPDTHSVASQEITVSAGERKEALAEPERTRQMTMAGLLAPFTHVYAGHTIRRARVSTHPHAPARTQSVAVAAPGVERYRPAGQGCSLPPATKPREFTLVLGQ